MRELRLSRSCCRRPAPREWWETLIDTADPWHSGTKTASSGDRYELQRTLDGGAAAQALGSDRVRTGSPMAGRQVTNGKDIHEERLPARRSAATTGQPALDPRLLRASLSKHLPRGRRRPIPDQTRRPVNDLIVSADVYADGHDVVAAALLYRRQGATAWTRTPMTAIGNDRWTAGICGPELGRYGSTVEGWIDRFGTWRHEISKKFGAGQDVASELLEGAEIVSGARQRHRRPTPRAARGAARGTLSQWAATLGDTALSPERRVVIALEADLQQAMSDPRRSQPCDAIRAHPRSDGRTGARSLRRLVRDVPALGRHRSVAQRHVREAAERLPYIAGMGFDVLYLPPIHPIGRSFRKGPNNTLHARPGRSGQPVGDRRARGRAQGRSTRSSARSTTSIASSKPRAPAGSRSRSTSPSRARRIIPT